MMACINEAVLLILIIDLPFMSISMFGKKNLFKRYTIGILIEL